MNILYLSLAKFDNINVRGIHSDLMRELIARGNNVFLAAPTERRYGRHTHVITSEHCHILKIRTLNIRNTNVVEKGLATLLIEWQFTRAIERYWGDVCFDLVLYVTPPITFNRVIQRIKRRCACRSYLMLKDIFPQNAIDLGMMSKNGLLYRIFRKKEIQLYEISDRIGCMSPANCTYVLEHNPSITAAKVEICPNAIIPVNTPRLSEQERADILARLHIPVDKKIFIYGGNFGKPQGLDFLLRVIEENEHRNDSFILLVGNGTEFIRVSHWFERHCPKNAHLLPMLPKEDYDKLIRAAHIGLIFLDRRFTIPNFPSRLLSYLENSMPVLLATDVNTDIGRIAEQAGFGLWCENGDIDTFMSNMETLVANPAKAESMGICGRQYLLDNYTIQQVADIILRP